MDFVYTFGDPSVLYLNVTNRCTNDCVFCVGRHSSGLGGAHLRGDGEPSAQVLLEAVDDAGGIDTFEEVVWCGFGEPTVRLDVVVEVSQALAAAGFRRRLNTNGHGCLLHGPRALDQLGAVIDVVSVSLNAPTPERYAELCRPVHRPGLPGELAGLAPGEYWAAVVDFLRRGPDHFAKVRASVVGHVLEPSEIDDCRELAWRTGCSDFLVR
jgi:TatD DNase family protein